MKILLRNWNNNEEYIWKDATYTKDGFCVDGQQVVETNIVSVLNDNRKQYIKCSSCGEIFRKGSRKWKQHITPVTDTSRCFGCKYLKIANEQNEKHKYTLMPNGKYQIIDRYEGNLVCGMRYFDKRDINTEDARMDCVYNRCSHMPAYNEISDIFMTHKGVFDDIITVDRIIDVGYTESGSNWYKLKAKNTIYAYVNKMGIVDFFQVRYKNDSWTAYYSKKYDKLFMIGNRGNYVEFSTYHIPNESINNIKKKIASLYQ